MQFDGWEPNADHPGSRPVGTERNNCRDRILAIGAFVGTERYSGRNRGGVTHATVLGV